MPGFQLLRSLNLKVWNIRAHVDMVRIGSDATKFPSFRLRLHYLVVIFGGDLRGSHVALS
jgi:hypothetical protein